MSAGAARKKKRSLGLAGRLHRAGGGLVGG